MKTNNTEKMDLANSFIHPSLTRSVANSIMQGQTIQESPVGTKEIHDSRENHTLDKNKVTIDIQRM